ncbi:MAG: hypothetical protein VX593_11465 [Pseudomonadota bacterium]|nr:hypothetical protein [Pseudomonadota bacterium]
MKIARTIAVASILALSAACASTPDYRQAASDRSQGYSETQLEQNRYAVTYRLKNDDARKARKLALRRAAALTLERGFDTFELVSQSSDAQTEREVDRGRVGPERVYTRDCGLLGCTTSVQQVPGDPFGDEIARERNEIAVTLEIIMSNKDAAVSPALYDASEVYANLSD